jgi:hypothetical protein
MGDWFAWDYFGKTTLVRHESVSQFNTIEELFPDGNAFVDPAWRSRVFA